MKNISCALLVFIWALFIATGFSAAQKTSELKSNVLQISPGSGAYIYEKIIDIPNISKKEIYNKAKQWILDNLKTDKDNIYFDDTEYNTLKATVYLGIKDFSIDITRQRVDFKLAFSFKDNKMKVEAHSFTYYGVDGSGAIFQKEFGDLKPIRKKFQEGIYKDFDQNFNRLIQSLESNITNTKSSEDW
jgi:hypothetical protein